MQSAQHSTYTPFKPQARLYHIGLIFLSIALVGCQKSEPEASVDPVQKVELIQQDLVRIQHGASVTKTTFTGTIRAVNQSTIQAQVTATATTVNAQVGQQVQKGQVLLRLNNQDNAARLAQAQANLAAAQAQANQARLMVQRKERLLQQGFVSKVEYEQSKVDYQAQVENTNAQQANVNIARKADQDGTIVSPIQGVITKRQVEPGQTVAAGTTLFEIVDPTQLEIQAQLPSDAQSALKLGQAIEYRIQGNNQLLNATLSRISPIADPASRQIEFFAQPKEAITSLSIGSFVEGQILGSDQVSGQLIPLNTVHDLDSKPYVWIVRQNKIAKAYIQVLEQRYSSNIAVVTGLEDSDLISRVKFSDNQIRQDVSISKN